MRPVRVLPHIKRLDELLGRLPWCVCCASVARAASFRQALVFLTRRSDIMFAGWASWRNTARHGFDAETTHENHQFRCVGCRSTAYRGYVFGHLLRRAARCRAPSERGYHRASGAQIEVMRELFSPLVDRVLVLVRSLGPYAAIELLLPGGSMLALLYWWYRQRVSRTRDIPDCRVHFGGRPA